MSLVNCPVLSQPLKHVAEQESVFSHHMIFLVKIKWLDKKNSYHRCQQTIWECCSVGMGYPGSLALMHVRRGPLFS